MSIEVYNQKLDRIKKAVALEPVDKVPFAPCANAYWAKSNGIKVADYITDFDLACDTNIKSMLELGGVDATQNEVFSPYLLPGMWLSNIAVPGRDISDDELWQVLEQELITAEDYDIILKDGFGPWLDKFKKEILRDPDSSLAPLFAYMPTAREKYIDAGIPCICDFLLATPFEHFCGGRSLPIFFMEDLIDNADKMDEVFKVTMEHNMAMYRGMLETMKPNGVWIGGWRTSPNMMSMELFDRFVWPYLKQYTELVLEYDVIPTFHLDANWDNAMEKFREMPEKKCILALDSKTDIRRAKEILGDRMCILGDVPAELLAFGTPKQVFDHTTELIRDIGPTGYILASGCDIPTNAKKENVQAMNDAAVQYPL